MRAGLLPSGMRRAVEADWRVIVKTLWRPPKPFGWLIIDDADGREIHQSSDGFRTSLLAWCAGNAALDHFRSHGRF
jgi:hypothetical protein